MPILYQPPDPVAPAVSAGYGQAVQYGQDLPSLVHAQVAAAQLRQQQVESFQQQQGRQAALDQAGGQQRAALDAQVREGRRHDDLQASVAQAQLSQAPQLQRQHAELASWLSQQELSQQEVMNLRQQQNAIGAVLDNDSLTDEEKQDALLQIKARISPSLMRQQNGMAKIHLQNVALENQRMQAMAAHAETAAKVSAMTAQDRTKEVFNPGMLDEERAALPPVDPVAVLTRGAAAVQAERELAAQDRVRKRGGAHPVVMGLDGKMVPLHELAGAGAGRGATEEVAAKHEDAARAEWHKAYDAALKTVDGWAAAHHKEGSGPAAKDVALYPQFRDPEQYRRHVDAELNRRLGHPSDQPALGIDDYVAKRTGRRPPAPAPTPAGPTPGGGPPTPGDTNTVPSNVPTPPPAAPRQAELVAAQRPFKAGKPATPQQQAVIDEMGTVKREIDAADVPAWHKERLRREADALVHWLGEYGSVSQFPEQLQASYRAFRVQLGNLPGPRAAETPAARRESGRADHGRRRPGEY